MTVDKTYVADLPQKRKYESVKKNMTVDKTYVADLPQKRKYEMDVRS